jgi:hypothetical protein
LRIDFFDDFPDQNGQRLRHLWRELQRPIEMGRFDPEDLDLREIAAAGLCQNPEKIDAVQGTDTRRALTVTMGKAVNASRLTVELHGIQDNDTPGILYVRQGVQDGGGGPRS